MGNNGDFCMLLTGSFKRSLDDKLRIAVPKRLRDSFSTSKESDRTAVLYIAPGTDGSLSLFTEESFSRLAGQLEQRPSTSKEVRAFSRLFFSRAESLDVDKQGRIRIPTELAALAELSGEAMLIGVRDRMEIWNLDRWQQYIKENENSYDQLAEQALSQQK